MQDVRRALLPSGASRGKNLLPCLFQLLELPTFFGWWPFLYLQSQQHCSFAALWLFSHSHMLLHYLGVLQWISLLKTKDISNKKKKKDLLFNPESPFLRKYFLSDWIRDASNVYLQEHSFHHVAERNQKQPAIQKLE